jgi:endonuclease G, mitochondrial
MRILRSSVYILSVYLLIVSCARQKITTSNDSIHLLLGNPTNAQASESTPDNYLIVKPQYALSYNRAKGHANWVAWELSQKWLGSSDRQNDFRPDPVLPASWYKVTPNDYSNSGFDRGHLCPSADRTNSVDNNSTAKHGRTWKNIAANWWRKNTAFLLFAAPTARAAKAAKEH